MITRFDAGKKLSNALVHNGIVYISGLVGWAHRGGSVAEQAVEILQRIDSYLEQAGSHKTRLLWVQVWLRDISRIDEFNEVWTRWAVPGRVPARAAVQAALAGEGLDVEIAAVAAIGDREDEGQGV